MTAQVTASDRLVVRLLSPPSRTTQHSAARGRRAITTGRHAITTGRHAIAPGRRAAYLYLVPGPSESTAPRWIPGHRSSGRHRVPLPRRGLRPRPAHAPLDRYDRAMIWIAGALLQLRIALVGVQPISEY
jgi:hypothetical protein